MPLFGPSQYSRQTSDSFGILHVNTPCLIFNQPHIGSNEGKYEAKKLQEFSVYLPAGTPHVVDKWSSPLYITDNQGRKKWNHEKIFLINLQSSLSISGPRKGNKILWKSIFISLKMIDGEYYFRIPRRK